jgi:pimeloyl-ACP methyl ester carboxylesterase
MKEERFTLGGIPAVLFGDESDRVCLFVHGQGGSKEEAAAFAETACPAGYQVLGIDLPEHGKRQESAEKLDPWTVVPELNYVMDYLEKGWDMISLRANSVGAWMSMQAFTDRPVEQALFVSPVVDMEKLIVSMMGWANVTGEELERRGEIPTDFGQTLSWKYLRYVREHPLRWNKLTQILYAGHDNMTDRDTIDTFCEKSGAGLTVMENGEHWFHTPEQLTALKKWEYENLDKTSNRRIIGHSNK